MYSIVYNKSYTSCLTDKILHIVKKMTSTTDYINDFDPEWYLDTYYSSVDTFVDEENIEKFIFDSHHEIFSKGKCNLTCKCMHIR